MKKEVVPHWKLSVKVLRAKFLQSYDYFSASDLYVTLHLPTASAITHRTKCISNCNTPEWNETFHFRVPSQIKNILEISICDQDVLYDDLCAQFLFDVNKLTLGQKCSDVFTTEKKDQLWVEFELNESPEEPRQYISNGVLVGAPLSTVEVKFDKSLSSAVLLKYTETDPLLDDVIPLRLDMDLVLKLKGAYKEDWLISLSEESSLVQTLRYYVNKDLETEIGLWASASDKDKACGKVTAPIVEFVPKQQVKLPLPEAEDTVDLHLETVDRSEEDLKVRLDFDVPPLEKQFLVKRKAVVSRTLQQFLKLKTAPDPSKVPTVAVVLSGGGSRAMTAVYGSLKGLQKLNLLDAVSYITAVSGSTWAMTTLYSDPSWSRRDVSDVAALVQKELSKNSATLLSPYQLQYYYSELAAREQQGHPGSLIDMWGLVIENLIFGKKYTGTLSDQQRAVSEGQNPLPIYTAVNTKTDAKTHNLVAEWCEFTPYEVGFPKYGAFIPAENFGSEYYLGHMVKKLPESRISFLLGIWSSVFSANLTDLWNTVTGVIPSWVPWIGTKTSTVVPDSKPPGQDAGQTSSDASTLSRLMTCRPVISKVFNFMRGFFLHNNYTSSSFFTPWKDQHPDAFPNKLTPVDSSLELVDSGFAINSSFSPVLRSHRRADLILSFDYSWELNQFNVLKETEKYCTDRQLPFPKIDFNKLLSEPLREVYVFEDEQNPAAPIIVHFPLTNASFKQYKAPGVERTGNEEKKDGEVDVSTSSSPYVTKQLTYATADFQKLTQLSCYNVLNNKEALQHALTKVLQRGSREQEKPPNPSTSSTRDPQAPNPSSLMNSPV